MIKYILQPIPASPAGESIRKKATFNYTVQKAETDFGETKEKNNFTPKQWETFWNRYQKEPSMIFANLNSSNNTFTYVYNSKNIDTKEAKEAYNKAEQEKISFFRIPIETQLCDQ